MWTEKYFFSRFDYVWDIKVHKMRNEREMHGHKKKLCKYRGA